MEDIYEYRVDPLIEGLSELTAARSAWVNYHQAKQEYEHGDRNFEDIPAYDPDQYSALKKKYPAADVYLQAEAWLVTGEPIKIRLGTRGMKKIIDGEDPAEVLAYMEQELAAFKQAQEG